MRIDNVAGAIFGCTNETEGECLSRKLFGLKGTSWNTVAQVAEGMPLWLYNFERKILRGVFRAAGPGTYNLVPLALQGSPNTGSAFPAQCSVTWGVLHEPIPLHQLQSTLPQIFYSSSKFRFALSQDEVDELMTLFGKGTRPSSLPLPAQRQQQHRHRQQPQQQPYSSLASGRPVSYESYTHPEDAGPTWGATARRLSPYSEQLAYGTQDEPGQTASGPSFGLETEAYDPEAPSLGSAWHRPNSSSGRSVAYGWQAAPHQPGRHERSSGPPMPPSAAPMPPSHPPLPPTHTYNPSWNAHQQRQQQHHVQGRGNSRRGHEQRIANSLAVRDVPFKPGANRGSGVARLPDGVQTTLSIKNLPAEFEPDALVDLLDGPGQVQGHYDFLYLFLSDQVDSWWAVLNFTSPKAAMQIKAWLHRKEWHLLVGQRGSGNGNAWVTASALEGRQALADAYADTAVCHEGPPSQYHIQRGQPTFFYDQYALDMNVAQQASGGMKLPPRSVTFNGQPEGGSSSKAGAGTGTGTGRGGQDGWRASAQPRGSGRGQQASGTKAVTPLAGSNVKRPTSFLPASAHSAKVAAAAVPDPAKVSLAQPAGAKAAAAVKPASSQRTPSARPVPAAAASPPKPAPASRPAKSAAAAAPAKPALGRGSAKPAALATPPPSTSSADAHRARKHKLIVWDPCAGTRPATPPATMVKAPPAIAQRTSDTPPVAVPPAKRLKQSLPATDPQPPPASAAPLPALSQQPARSPADQSAAPQRAPAKGPSTPSTVHSTSQQVDESPSAVPAAKQQPAGAPSPVSAALELSGAPAGSKAPQHSPSPAAQQRATERQPAAAGMKRLRRASSAPPEAIDPQAPLAIKHVDMASSGKQASHKQPAPEVQHNVPKLLENGHSVHNAEAVQQQRELVGGRDADAHVSSFGDDFLELPS